jgi:cation transport ATPase
LQGSGRTVVYVARGGALVGMIAVADAIRSTSVDAIARLRALGIDVVMLTGDNRATAERIARELGIDIVLAEVLPRQKAEEVRKLRQQGKKMHQNLFWAVAYNVVAFPLAAGVLYPLLLRPEIAALAMSGSTVLVTGNALLLKRFRIERKSARDLTRATSPQSK